MMIDFNLEGQKIIPLQEAIAELGVSFEKFAEIVTQVEVLLIILPKNPVNIGIRHKNKFVNTSGNAFQNNPLKTAVEGVDGFVVHPIDNEKILNSMNWKACEPMLVSYTDGKNKLAVLQCPYGQASLNSICQYRHEVKENNIEDVMMLGYELAKLYKDQVFYFKEHGNLYTEISIKEIYTTTADLDTIKFYLMSLYMPIFNDVGGYELNSWSSDLIKDINAAHHYLIKNNIIIRNIGEKTELEQQKYKENILLWESRIRECLKYRWKNKKNISRKVCFDCIPRIITERLNLPISLSSLGANYGQIVNNRDDATDLIFLFDIAAEKFYKNERGFRVGKQIEQTLIDIGLARGDHRTAIYSVIKESGKEKFRKRKISKET